jgi:ABC-2 type transport system ATP-binding protein
MDQGRIEAMDTPAQLKKLYNAKNMDEVFIKIAR